MDIFRSRTTQDVSMAGGSVGVMLAVMTFIGEVWPDLALSAEVQAAVVVLLNSLLIPFVSRTIAKVRGRQSVESALSMVAPEDVAVLEAVAARADRRMEDARVNGPRLLEAVRRARVAIDEGRKSET